MNISCAHTWVLVLCLGVYTFQLKISKSHGSREPKLYLKFVSGSHCCISRSLNSDSSVIQISFLQDFWRSFQPESLAVYHRWCPASCKILFLGDAKYLLSNSLPEVAAQNLPDMLSTYFIQELGTPGSWKKGSFSTPCNLNTRMEECVCVSLLFFGTNSCKQCCSYIWASSSLHRACTALRKAQNLVENVHPASLGQGLGRKRLRFICLLEVCSLFSKNYSQKWICSKVR